MVEIFVCDFEDYMVKWFNLFLKTICWNVSIYFFWFLSAKLLSICSVVLNLKRIKLETFCNAPLFLCSAAKILYYISANKCWVAIGHLYLLNLSSESTIFLFVFVWRFWRLVLRLSFSQPCNNATYVYGNWLKNFF